MIRNLFKKIDIFGTNYQMKYKRMERFQTAIGGLVSILVIALIIFTTTIFFRNYIDTTKPDINMSTSIEARAPKRHLFDLVYPTGIGLYLSPDRMIPATQMQRFVTPMAFVYEMNTNNLGATGEVTFDAIEIIQFKPCVDVEDTTLTADFRNPLTDTLTQFTDLYLACMDVKKKEELFTISNAMAPPYRFVQTKIFPCMMPNPADCATPMELVRTHVNIASVQTSFQPSKKENPLERVPSLKDFTIGINQETINEINLKGNKIYDDEFDLAERKLRFEYIDHAEETVYTASRLIPKTHCTMAQIVDFTCLPYITLALRSSGKTVTIVRKYPKILETLGEIGGTGDLIVLFFGFLYAFWNSYSMQEFKKKRVLTTNYDAVKKVYEKAGKEETKRLEQLTNEIVHKRDDIVRLYNNISGLEVLQDVLFEDFHKTLLPLLILNIEKRKQEAGPAKRFSHVSMSGLSINSRVQPARGFQRAQTQYAKGGITKNTFYVAYQKLKDDQPQNDMRKVLNQFFMKNVPKEVKNFGMGIESNALQIQDLQEVLDDRGASDMRKCSLDNFFEQENKKYGMNGVSGGIIEEGSHEGVEIADIGSEAVHNRDEKHHSNKIFPQKKATSTKKILGNFGQILGRKNKMAEKPRKRLVLQASRRSRDKSTLKF